MLKSDLLQTAMIFLIHCVPLPLAVSCFSKIQIGFTFLVPAHVVSPGKRAVERVCVCVCVYNCIKQLEVNGKPGRERLRHGVYVLTHTDGQTVPKHTAYTAAPSIA